jgi:hypothetical protein
MKDSPEIRETLTVKIESQGINETFMTEEPSRK